MPEKPREAVKWYRKAAVQGSAEAQDAMGFMYDYGRGVLEDDVLAFAWYNLAAAQGYKSAIRAKNRLRLRITGDLLAEAQEISAELFKRIESSKSK